MKRTKEYEKFKEIQRSENEQMEYRQQNVFHLNTKVMSLESELKIANRKLKTEAHKLDKLQSELDSCKEEKTFEAKKATNLIDEMKKQISTLKGSEMQSEKLEDRSWMHVACSINQDIYKIILIAFVHLLGAVFKNLKQTNSQILPSNIPSLGRPPGKLWKCLGELIQKNSNYKSRLTLPLLQMMIQKNAKESTAGECKMKNGSASAAMSQTSWCDRQLQYACSDPSRIQTELVCGMIGVNSLELSS